MTSPIYPRGRLGGHTRSKHVIIVAAGAFAVSAVTASAATPRVETMPVHSLDTTLKANGETRPAGQDYARVGAGYGDLHDCIYVMPVELPYLDPGESVAQATLSVNLQGYHNWGEHLQNIDLFGSSYVSGNPTVDSLYYLDAANPGSYPDATLLEDNLATPADIGSNSASGLTNVKVSEDFSGFIRTLYDGGATPGEYAFLSLAHDGILAQQSFYRFTNAGHGSLPEPSVEFTIDVSPGLTVSDTVTWTIGDANSAIDGVAGAGPVTFTWEFNVPVTHGQYVDGTPFVIWQQGLELVDVTPSKTTEDLPDWNGVVREDAVTDATVINPEFNGLALDERMSNTDGSGHYNGGVNTWDETAATLQVGDCIVTGLGRRTERARRRDMVFTAIGVCNIVGNDMTGHYRPPLRMPASQRATLVTPEQVDVSQLPSFALQSPVDWSGNSVNMDLSTVAGHDPDVLLNGPIGNCGITGSHWYQAANGMLNHYLPGTSDNGYQRDVSGRYADCLYTAFDPGEPLDKRQRSLDKFIQSGLDYYYHHCLGYPIGNGGGGHCTGIEGLITLTGALLGDADMTDAIKYQRFLGSEVGTPGVVVDMHQESMGAFTRSEATHTIAPAAWQSGTYHIRPIGNGAANLNESIIRLDYARSDHVLNNANVPYTNLQNIDGLTAVTIDGGFTWPMFTQNRGAEAKRSYGFPYGAVLRIDGDPQVRKIISFEKDAATGWSESTWKSAGGQGGVFLIYPPLTSAELNALNASGTLTTGISTRAEAEVGSVILWDSWPVDDLNRVLTSYTAAPVNSYLNIKVADNFYWLPYYHLLDDPGAPGKKLYEESPTYAQLKAYIQMQRDAGDYFWERFSGGGNVPDEPVVQALVRHYLLDGQMPSAYCKTYGPSEAMWTD